jgi:hypothetical protein
MQRPVLSAGLIGDVADDLWSADIDILPGLRRPTQYNYRLLYHGFLRTCSGDNCVSALPFIGPALECDMATVLVSAQLNDLLVIAITRHRPPF